MKKEIIYCFKKDIKEFTRKKYNLICLFTLLSLATLVLTMSKYFPSLLAIAMEKNNNILVGSDSINQLTTNVFPQSLKENMGIVSSDIIIFYGLIVILITYSIIPKEIHSGKWILPLGAGYTKKILLHSKAIVYSCGMSLPVFAIYNAYYAVGAMILNNNYNIYSSMINSVFLMLSMFVIVYCTFMLSIIYKKTLFAAITPLSIVVFAPDIMSIFSFGKFFPTYILTFIYNSSYNIGEIIIPICELLLIILIMIKYANIKIDNIEVRR